MTDVLELYDDMQHATLHQLHSEDSRFTGCQKSVAQIREESPYVKWDVTISECDEDGCERG